MKQRAVVRFFTIKKLSVKDIRSEFEGAYGHEALSPSPVKKWHKCFANGRINLDDDPRSGIPHNAISASQGEPLSKKVILSYASACA
jgi:hypothetical protein